MDVPGLGYAAGAQCEDVAINRLAKRQQTYIERVDYALQDAEQRLADLKRMKEIFAQHPEFEELLTLVQRGRV